MAPRSTFPLVLLVVLFSVTFASSELPNTTSTSTTTNRPTPTHGSDAPHVLHNVPPISQPSFSRLGHHTPQPSRSRRESDNLGSTSIESSSNQQNSDLSTTATAPSSPTIHPDVSNITTSSTLSSILHNALSQYNQPGIAAVIIKNGRIIDRGAAGIRKVGRPEQVTMDDLWHIGSCTKSFCGTLVGLMVDRGIMTWSTTIGEVFPELLGSMNPAYVNVTVKLLLEHRSGAPPNGDSASWEEAAQQIGTPTEQRRRYVTAALVKPPQYSPGTAVVYSNLGITIAGAMVERITDVSWETMTTEWVTKPLGINSVGFGPPATVASPPDQPLGHYPDGSGGWIPVMTDNPPAIAPAARIHIKADDLARWLIAHVEGERGGFDYFMSSNIWNDLHTPPSGRLPWPNYQFALGWSTTDRYITHNGETYWHTVMWADTTLKDGIVVFVNTPTGAAANYALNSILTGILYPPSPPPPIQPPPPPPITSVEAPTATPGDMPSPDAVVIVNPSPYDVPSLLPASEPAPEATPDSSPAEEPLEIDPISPISVVTPAPSQGNQTPAVDPVSVPSPVLSEQPSVLNYPVSDSKSQYDKKGNVWWIVLTSVLGAAIVLEP